MLKRNEKRVTVKELKEMLNGVGDDFWLKVSVTYDDCDHIQNFQDVYVDGSWLVLCGKC